MTSANFKGKPVFSDSNSDMKIGTGVKDTSINIGIKQVEYDDLYDHINSPTSSITPGIRYEIIKPLTDDQKETILARTSGLNAEQLVVGAQFTVIAQAANGDGAVFIQGTYTTLMAMDLYPLMPHQKYHMLLALEVDTSILKSIKIKKFLITLP
ncbi:MAG: hypothetical protein CM15mP85_31510 [Rhodobacterales bacterium]|nr:MAG: hypothetical protein CM15mP85_31510 [Rhodobacterales bacterium]